MCCRDCNEKSLKLVHEYNHDIFHYKDYKCSICGIEALVWEYGVISWYEPNEEDDD